MQVEKDSVLGMPSTYRIRVLGRLGESWSDRLGGMAIASNQQAGGQWVTTLHGRVADQAALSGVLNSLYDLGFCLLLVERVEPCPSEIHNRKEG